MPLVSAFSKIDAHISKKSALAGLRIVFFTFLSASISSAATLFDSGLVALSTADPIQQGRISRDSVLSDWSSPKAFPGVVNAAVPYRYRTFILPSVMYPYLQISVDDVNETALTFVSAYLNAYAPDITAPNYGLNANYLGDEGYSGNLAGNPRPFQVVVPVGSTLVLAVNDVTATGSGIGQPLRLIVEGFTDTNYSDAPEPGTFGLLTATLVAAAVTMRRKQKLIR